MKRFSYALMAILLVLVLVLGISCKAETPVPDNGSGQTASASLSKSLANSRYQTSDLTILGMAYETGVLPELSFDGNSKPAGIPMDGYEVKTDTETEYSFVLKDVDGNITATYSFIRDSESPRLLKGSLQKGEEIYETDLYPAVGPEWAEGLYYALDAAFDMFRFSDDGLIELKAWFDEIRSVALEYDDESALFEYRFYNENETDDTKMDLVLTGYIKVMRNGGALSFSVGTTPEEVAVEKRCIRLEEMNMLPVPETDIAMPDWGRNLIMYKPDPNTSFHSRTTIYFDNLGQLSQPWHTYPTKVLSISDDSVILVSDKDEMKLYKGIYKLDDTGSDYVIHEIRVLEDGRVREGAGVYKSFDNTQYANTVWLDGSNMTIFFDNLGIMHFYKSFEHDLDSHSSVDGIYVYDGVPEVYMAAESTSNPGQMWVYHLPSTLSDTMNVNTYHAAREGGGTFPGDCVLTRRYVPEELKNLTIISGDKTFHGLDTDAIHFDANGRPDFIDADDLYWYGEVSSTSFEFFVRKKTDGVLASSVARYELNNFGVMSSSTFEVGKESSATLENGFSKKQYPPENFRDTSWISEDGTNTLVFDADGYFPAPDQNLEYRPAYKKIIGGDGYYHLYQFVTFKEDGTVDVTVRFKVEELDDGRIKVSNGPTEIIYGKDVK